MQELSEKERQRLALLRLVEDGLLTVREAARSAGLSPRQLRRLRRRYEREGDGSLAHRLRGRPGNRRRPQALRERALERAREPLFAGFGPTLLSEHLARDPAVGPLAPTTLRRWLIEAGLWQVHRPRRPHRRRRERRAAFGQLVLMDTSVHPWLEGRAPEEPVLVALLDDATSTLLCRFFPRETGAANRTMILAWLLRYGRMEALYVDRALHFWPNGPKPRPTTAPRPQKQSLIQRALQRLGTELIFAHSPQAKGRIERTFATLQDRLVKELRLAQASSLPEANHYLEHHFLPFWNSRFAVAPRLPTDAHQPLPEAIDLLALFAETTERTIRSDYTFRYRNVHYQIEAADAKPTMPHQRITIEERLDGSTRFRWKEHYLTAHPLPPTNAHPQPPRPPTPRRPIPDDHPWRRFPIRVGQGRLLGPRPTNTRQTAPAAPSPTTHSPQP